MIIAGRKCDIYITQREALASSIEILGVYDYWRIIEKYPWLLADYSHKSDYLKIIAGGKCDIYITQREALASSIEILGVYDYWRIIEKYPWLLADYSHKSDYLKIIAGGKCDIYITQREALASSIEKCWMTVWLSGDYL